MKRVSKRPALIAGLVLLCIALAGFQAYAQEQHDPTVCVVGELESGPNLSAKAIYLSDGVSIIMDQTDAECARLTGGARR